MADPRRGEIGHPILCVLPGRADDLMRLRELSRHDNPLVTVVGKYNHGKSRLLNELVGDDIFAVADRRETVTLSEHANDSVRWLDAPGLDADVDHADDRHAMQAVWLKSDIRLFVHAAKEGELDAKELAWLKALRSDELRTRRQTLLVLSQIDQLADEAEIGDVRKAVDAQMPDVALQAVSAPRHRQGVEQSKSLLVERSGVPALRTWLKRALARVPDARACETRLLFREIRQDLAQRRAEQEGLLSALRQKQILQRESFDRELGALLDKIAKDVGLVVDADIHDHAIVPDSSAEKYKLTQAKLERARIQIAYSRACIQIDGLLAAHKVVGLPKEQQTVAASLNTVMVAVMGVSVKFRRDLRNTFCEDKGRRHITTAFVHYFELSGDRQALKAAIAGAEEATVAVACAWAALQTMEANA